MNNLATVSVHACRSSASHPHANRSQGSHRSHASRWGTLALIAALTALTNGCADPLRAEQIEALGPEVDGFEEGEFHRPGQPCLTCHSPGGIGDAPDFSFGGTLFARPSDGSPSFMVEGYTVEILDSKARTFRATSNKCGNFYIEAEDFVPAFPVRAEILGPNPDAPGSLITNVVMTSRIARDGSCAGCHTTPENYNSPGEVFVLPPTGDNAPQPPPAGACPPPYAKISVP